MPALIWCREIQTQSLSCFDYLEIPKSRMVSVGPAARKFAISADLDDWYFSHWDKLGGLNRQLADLHDFLPSSANELQLPSQVSDSWATQVPIRHLASTAVDANVPVRHLASIAVDAPPWEQRKVGVVRDAKHQQRSHKEVAPAAGVGLRAMPERAPPSPAALITARNPRFGSMRSAAGDANAPVLVPHWATPKPSNPPPTAASMSRKPLAPATNGPATAEPQAPPPSAAQPPTIDDLHATRPQPPATQKEVPLEHFVAEKVHALSERYNIQLFLVRSDF